MRRPLAWRTLHSSPCIILLHSTTVILKKPEEQHFTFHYCTRLPFSSNKLWLLLDFEMRIYFLQQGITNMFVQQSHYASPTAFRSKIFALQLHSAILNSIYTISTNTIGLCNGLAPCLCYYSWDTTIFSEQPPLDLSWPSAIVPKVKLSIFFEMKVKLLLRPLCGIGTHVGDASPINGGPS